jgi:pumilio family protein 6
MEEDQFEDVGLDDEGVKPKKKGIFSRFGDFSGDGQSGASTSKPTSHLGFHLPGRKKAQAPPSSEMGAIKSPAPPEVSELREA